MRTGKILGWTCMVWTLGVYVTAAAVALGFVKIASEGAGMICVMSTMVTGAAAVIFVIESFEPEGKR